MRDLTEEEVLELIGKSVADFSKDIVLFVPSLKFEQPFIMYQSARLGHTKKHLSNDIKAIFDSGIYKYTPKSKPFDINKDGLSDSDIEDIEIVNYKLRMYLMSNDLVCIEHTKDDAIAIAKALGVTGEDLK